MKTRAGVMLCGLLLLAASAFAQGNKPKQERHTVTELLDHSVSNFEHEFMPAAEAMPEDKFNFAPTNGEFKGVRTFAQQIKHVAAVNYMFGAAIVGEKPPVDIGSENGPDSMTSKADIVKFLKDSFAYLHKSLNTLDGNNLLIQVQSPFGPNKITKLALTNIALSHPFDHYGQMVVYLRMNGIIPPASRGQ